MKDMGGPSRPRREVTVHSEKKGPAENKNEREESVLMSQSEGRRVTHMVPPYWPQGQREMSITATEEAFKAVELTLKLQSASPAAEQKALRGRGLPPIKG